MSADPVTDLDVSLSHRLRDALGRFALSMLVLTVTIALAPGLEAENPGGVLLAAFWCAVAALVIRPLLVRMVLPFGWWGSAFVVLFANAVVMYVGISLAPWIEDDGFWSVFWASWIYSVLAVLFEWILLADADGAFLSYAIRMSRRRNGNNATEQGPGVVFVQLDGVPFPVLAWASSPARSRRCPAGCAPGYAPRGRVDGPLPCTTPASQAGILHGYDRRHAGVPLVREGSGGCWSPTSPADAAIIERRHSDGPGLLADDGVSIGNLFTGDAPREPADDERGAAGCDRLGPRAATPRSSPTRRLRPALVLTVGEMVKERFQAPPAAAAGHRAPDPIAHGAYVALRAVTNVHAARPQHGAGGRADAAGTSIYVDYVDYDEVAHHAGVFRPESLAAR